VFHARAIALALLFALVSCVGSTNGDASHGRRTWSIDRSADPYGSELPGELGASTLDAHDRSFVAEAAEREIRHIVLVRLGLRRSMRDDVRELAWRLADAHLGIARQLHRIARAHRIELATELDAESRAERDRLLGAQVEDFDRLYLEIVAADQRDARELYATQGPRLHDAALRSWAEQTLARVEGHLEQTAELAAEVDAPVSLLRRGEASTMDARRP
jgi:putative membrane protein